MKGIIIFDKNNTALDIPSVAVEPKITHEDTFAFAKRNISGEMRRINYIGTVIKMEPKWSLLTAAQFTNLCKAVRGTFFNVKFVLEGQVVTKQFYSGNISYTPYILNQDGTPKYYKDVSFSMISQGVYK